MRNHRANLLLIWLTIAVLGAVGSVMRAGLVACSDSTGAVQIELGCDQNDRGLCSSISREPRDGGGRTEVPPGPCQDVPLESDLFSTLASSRSTELPVDLGLSSPVFAAAWSPEPVGPASAQGSSGHARPPDAIARLRCIVLTV